MADKTGKDKKHGEDKKSKKEIMAALSLFSQIGITLAVTLFIGVMIGKFIDDIAGTQPVFLLIFSVIGILAAFRNLYEMTKKF